MNIVLYSSLAFCCEEEQFCIGDNQLTECESEKSKDHKEDSPCSPFFECGNCTGNIIINIPVTFQNNNLEKLDTYSPFLEIYHKKELQFKLLKPPMRIL